jgi:hypothetical protein
MEEGSTPPGSLPAAIEEGSTPVGSSSAAIEEGSTPPAKLLFLNDLAARDDFVEIGRNGRGVVATRAARGEEIVVPGRNAAAERPTF